VPCKGLVGPWAHKYPHLGVPGPAIGFLQETLRWFDHWMKGTDTGIMDEPRLRVWMQDSVPPSARYEVRPGRWVGEPDWPSPGNIQPTGYKLTYGLDLVPDSQEVPDDHLSIQSPLFVGLYAGKWCSYNAPPDLPHDQRDEDGGALVFDTPRLKAPVEICGQPEVELTLSSDKPVAMVAVRLVDVQPDDKATRISYGLLNLSHRDSDEFPEPLESGKTYRVRVKMKHIAQRFPAGHSIRLSISTVYWPLAWPAPEPVKLTVHTGQSRLVLPQRPPRPADDDALPAFAEPEGAPPLDKTQLVPTDEAWTVIRDLANDKSTLEVINDEGRYRINPLNLEIASRTTERYSYRGSDYLSLRGWTEWQRSFRRPNPDPREPDWEVTTITRTLMTSDATHFRIRATLDAFEGDSRVFAKTWDEAIPRDLV
jgi:hypothetical protein